MQKIRGLRRGRAVMWLAPLIAALVFGLVSGGFPQGRMVQAATPQIDCYNLTTFELRYITQHNSCNNSEGTIQLNDNTNPIWLCLAPGVAEIRYAGTESGGQSTSVCGVSGTYFPSPGFTELELCRNTVDGKFTIPPCSTRKRQVKITIDPRNLPPTALELAGSTVPENSFTGTLVGTLTGTDPDVGDTLTYSLTDTAGGRFKVVGNQLQVDNGSLLNFEANSSHNIKAKVSDQYNGSLVKTFTITITNVNEQPTDIIVSSNRVDENEPVGTLVGNLSAVDPDAGDSASFQLVSGSGSDDNASFIISGNQLVTNVAFNYESDDSYSIRVRATDSGSLQFEKSFTISIDDVNEQPTALLIDSTELGENRPVGSAAGILSTTDPDNNDSFIYTLVSGTGSTDNGSFQIDADRLEGAVVFDFETDSSYDVRVRTTDAGGLFTEQPFTITIIDRNDDPTDITLSSSTIQENQPASTSVATLSTTDQDSGDTFTYSLVSGSGSTDNAAFLIDGDVLRAVASFDFETKSSYTVRIRSTDSGTGFFEKSFTITIVDRNDPPTANGQTISTNEDTNLPLTLTGSDGDPAVVQALIFALTDQPDHGTLTGFNASTGAVTYEPAENYNGPDSFAFTVTDDTTAGGPGQTSSSATVSITVNAANDTPTANAQTVSTNEDTNLPITLTGTDGDPEVTQTLIFAITDQPDHGALTGFNANTGAVAYEPTANYNGPDSFAFTVTDDATAGGSAITSSAATISITVNAVNDTPTAIAQAVSTNEDVNLPVTLTGADSDPEVTQTLTFAITDQPDHGTLTGFNASTGAVTYEPTLNYNGPDSFAFTVTDDTTAGGAALTSIAATISITVNAVNDAPSFVLLDTSVAVLQNSGATTIPAFATSISKGPTDESAQTLTFTVTAGTVTGTLAFDIAPTINSTTGDLSFTLTDGTLGSASFSVVLSDNGGVLLGGDDASDPQIFTIATNNVPVSNLQAVSTNEDTLKTITMTASDGDDENLTFTIVDSPLHGTLSNIGAPNCVGVNVCAESVDYTPAADYNGPDSFTFKTNDGQDDSNIATVSITVNPINDTPTGNAQTVSTNEDTNLPLTLTGTDGDPVVTQSLTFAITDQPDHGTLTGFSASTGAVQYEPAANYNGPDSFQFTVTDDTTAGGAALTSAAATVSITVNAVNDTPTANAQTVSTNEDTDLPLTLTGADGDPEVAQTLTFTITDQPDNGTLTGFNANTGAVTYDPAANYNGSDSFAFTVTDDTTAGGAVLTSTAATISITVNAVNDAPVLANLETAHLAYTEGGVAIDLTDNLTVTDVDSTTVLNATITVSNGYLNGFDTLAFTPSSGITGNFVAGTGVLTLTHPSNTATPAQFQAALRTVTFVSTSENPGTTRTLSFQVNDGAGVNNLSNIPTRIIDVSSVNDAPVNTVPGGQTTLEDTAKVFNAANSNLISIADVDAGTNALQITLTGQNGVITLSGVSGLSFTAGDGNSDATMTFTGNISNINSALNGLSFLPTLHFNDNRGTSRLSIVTNDQGFSGNDPGTTGTATSEEDSDSIVISVTAVNDVPAASARNFGTDSIETNMQRSIDAANGLFNGASDPDTGDSGYTVDFLVGTVNGVAPVSGTITTTIASVGTVVADAATGAFTFDPAPGVTGTVSFPFTICDSGNPGPAACSTAVNVTFNISGPVTWFVNPALGTNGVGTLASPFNVLSSADAVDAANHRIFVYTGTTPGGITLNAGEWLIGQGVTGTTFDTLMGITVPAGTITRPSIGGTKPVVGNVAGSAVAVTGGTGIQIKGLSLSGSLNAIDVTTTTGAGVTIADNAITSAGLEGIDVNAGGGAVTVDVQTTTITSTGNGFDARSTAGTLGVVFSSNTSITSGATGVLIDGSGGGTTTISGFASNAVSGATTGGGVTVTSATFDATPGSNFQTVSGGTTTIGAAGAGNGVGGSGIVLTSVSGDLSFTDLDVFADGGTGLFVSGSTAYTSSAGIQVAVAFGVAVIEATGGPAVNLSTVTANLPLSSLKSTNSATTGVSLAAVSGTVSAPVGSEITNATGADFSISGGTAAVTYNGTITDDVGQLVSVSGATGGTKTFSGAITDGNDGDGSGVSITGNTGATIRFSGGLVVSTGANPAFTATGGGTVEVCAVNPCGGITAVVNTLTTSTGTALNVSSTTIGSNGLTFRSINVDGNDSAPANGIALNSTGSSGGLTVAGTGSAGSGGTIRDASGDGILLTTTERVSLSYMNITSNLGNGIGGSGVNGFVLSNDSITSNGNDAATDDSGVDLVNLTGSAFAGSRPTSITNTTISNNWEFELQITNNTGTLTDLQMSGNTISSDGASANHGNLFNFLVSGSSSANMALNLTSGSFTGAAPATATAIQCDHSGNGGTMTCNVSNATFTNNNVGPQGSVAGNGTLLVNFTGNTITGNRAIGINFFADANSPFTKSISGTVRNNVIGTLGVTNSGSEVGSGIRIQNEGAAPITLLIAGNTIQEVASFPGISVNVGLSGIATGGLATNLTITNNIIREMDGSRAITIQDNQNAPNAPAPTICVDMSGNSFSNIVGQAGDGSFVRIRELNGIVNVRQSTPTTSAIAGELDDANSGNDVTGTKYAISGSVQFNTGVCTQPAAFSGSIFFASSEPTGGSHVASMPGALGIAGITERNSDELKLAQSTIRRPPGIAGIVAMTGIFSPSRRVLQRNVIVTDSPRANSRRISYSSEVSRGSSDVESFHLKTQKPPGINEIGSSTRSANRLLN